MSAGARRWLQGHLELLAYKTFESAKKRSAINITKKMTMDSGQDMCLGNTLYCRLKHLLENDAR